MTLPPGIYRITQWGTHGQPQVLTVDSNENVTVAPPSEAPDKAQEWRLEVQEDGKVAIQTALFGFPSRSLSYDGEAEKGKRVILGPLQDFPTRFWRVEPAPQLPLPVPYFIRVLDKDLIAAVSGILIFPPVVALETGNNDLKNAWAFELLPPK